MQWQHRELTSTMRLQHRTGDYTALMRHEEGEWQHQYRISSNNTSLKYFIENQTFNTSVLCQTYLPQEREWMVGTKVPESYWSTREADRSDGLMYKSFLGNQYGACQLPEFEPSISTWVSKSHHQQQQTKKNNDYEGILSPTLRLILRLAQTNQSLCFAGDSIDFQMYDALIHNLQRQRLLQNMINISMNDERYVVPVNYTNDTGFPEYEGWMTISEIKERSVSLSYMNDDNTTMQTYSTTIRYFQMYGWSPWVTPFMEDCNILSLNLGLHYNARSKDMEATHYHESQTDSGPRPKLIDDWKAGITYLVDFISSKKDRVAVWRSTLPQHFDTYDGHHEEGNYNCSLKQLKIPDSGPNIQNYNNLTNHAFSTFCNRSQSKQPYAEMYEHECTVNVTSVEHRTVYNYLLMNRCTKLLEGYKTKRELIKGTILRWNIADLFDVPQWHHGGGDCSHFCYVMPLYEAAFERLEMLLPIEYITT